MRFLNNLKKNITATREVLNYINRCHSIYIELFLEKRERKNDRLVRHAKTLNKGDVDIN
jgi:hypothetical protein